jgi:hypothetical protein
MNFLTQINHYLIEHGTFFEAKQNPTDPNTCTIIGPNDFCEIYNTKELLAKLKQCQETNDVIDTLW